MRIRNVSTSNKATPDVSMQAFAFLKRYILQLQRGRVAQLFIPKTTSIYKYAVCIHLQTVSLFSPLGQIKWAKRRLSESATDTAVFKHMLSFRKIA